VGQLARLEHALSALAKDLGRRDREAALVSATARRINAGIHLDEVLEGVYRDFREIIPYHRIGCALLEDDGRRLSARWARSDGPASRLGPGYAAPMAGSSLEVVIRNGQPRIINDLVAYLDAHPRSKATRLLCEEGYRSSLTCPLIADGVPTGFLFFTSTEPGAYAAAHVELFQQIAAQLSVSVEKARLVSELAEQKRQVERSLRANRQLLEERTAALAALASTEERLRLAVDAAGIGVWDWDIEGAGLTWLGHHEKIFGLQPGGFDGRYETFIGGVHPDDRTGVEQAIASALASGAEYSHTHRVVLPDGAVRWVLGRGQYQYAADGRPLRMLGAIMDITGPRALEQQLLHAQKIEAVGQLAAGIAHEINTPTQYVGDNLRFLQDSFTALRGVLQAYRAVGEAARAAGPPVSTADRSWQDADMDYLMEEIPRASAQALDGVQRVTEIVRAMKDFSHPGGTAPALADLNRAIEDTITVTRNEWKYVAEATVDLAPSLPLVPCVLGEIQQVILNLIVNAAHAIKDRVGTSGVRGVITVSTSVVEDVVEVRVRDTGTGIPVAIRPHIFEPFFTTKEVGRGTGQGLSLSRDIVVKKHRGSLTFETEDGVGTTFIIRLPLAPAGLPQGSG
jgi:PAS domain S-box-containing protein